MSMSPFLTGIAITGAVPSSTCRMKMCGLREHCLIGICYDDDKDEGDDGRDDDGDDDDDCDHYDDHDDDWSDFDAP
jgi:hypothetical protein